MKTKSLLFAILFILGLNFAFASQPEVLMKNTILKEVKYPDFAVKQLNEGKVYITFTIDEKGKVTVKESNSLNQDLKNYVEETVNKIKVEPSSEFNGKTYSLKFTFELIK
jgi:outer membrane biosynthesis protein TonB